MNIIRDLICWFWCEPFGHIWHPWRDEPKAGVVLTGIICRRCHYMRIGVEA